MTLKSQPYRVLSLDGGGIRGIYTAAYLESVANAFSRQREVGALDVGAGFNLIVGTSTGGIVACALAMGVPLEDVVNLYREHGPRVFRRPVPTKLSFNALGDLIKRREALSQGEQSLREALQGILGNTTIAEMYEDRGIALAIPAIEMRRHRGWVFKTPHFKDTNRRDDNYTLVDVCMATSAAPVYRSIASVSCPEGPPRMFVDGGLWANNPVMISLIEALEVASSDQRIEIFCLGCYPPPAGEDVAHADLHRDLIGWRLGSDVALLAIDAQQTAHDNMARKVARYAAAKDERDCRVIRLPAEVPPTHLLQYFGLDDIRSKAADALVSQAQTDASEMNSRLSQRKSDSDEQAIYDLFTSIPELADQPPTRPIPPSNGPIQPSAT